MTTTEKAASALLAALRDASSHLEYCGYGDSWEREGAFDKTGGKLNLPEQIAAAIDMAEKAGIE